MTHRVCPPPLPLTSFSRTFSNTHFTPNLPASLLFSKHLRNVSDSRSLHLLFLLSRILFLQGALGFGLLLSSSLCSNISSVSLRLTNSFNIDPFPHPAASPPSPPFLLHFSAWHLPSSNMLNILLTCFVYSWSPFTRMKASIYFAGVFSSVLGSAASQNLNTV